MNELDLIRQQRPEVAELQGEEASEMRSSMFRATTPSMQLVSGDGGTTSSAVRGNRLRRWVATGAVTAVAAAAAGFIVLGGETGTPLDKVVPGPAAVGAAEQLRALTKKMESPVYPDAPYMQDIHAAGKSGTLTRYVLDDASPREAFLVGDTAVGNGPATVEYSTDLQFMQANTSDEFASSFDKFVEKFPASFGTDTSTLLLSLGLLDPDATAFARAEAIRTLSEDATVTSTDEVVGETGKGTRFTISPEDEPSTVFEILIAPDNGRVLSFKLLDKSKVIFGQEIGQPTPLVSVPDDVAAAAALVQEQDAEIAAEVPVVAARLEANAAALGLQGVENGCTPMYFSSASAAPGTWATELPSGVEYFTCR